MDKKKIRCAIYTRKSTEEGLEQDFNSLDAQREACEAYIKSQMHEGWVLIKKEYNDGGYSGGTMNRPAFQELLTDIEEDKVDIVVVYKVDRLTRSLMDFSKIIDVFDKHGTSFVSITQQFNTTTSMGRLTLNILLSFAQFEREVTGERIRDKIAASKRKGMWMSGCPPLGYKKENKKLVVEEKEAQKVKLIFDKYLDLQSVPKLMEYLKTENIRTRSDKEFFKGELYHMLSNKVYIGKIVHKENVYEGEHDGIIDDIPFERVQKLLYENKLDKICGTKCASNSLLTGLIFDDKNNKMTPSHSNCHGRRYRYYISQAIKKYKKSQAGSVSKIPAGEIEKFVVENVEEFLNSKKEIHRILSAYDLKEQERLINTIKQIEDFAEPKLIRAIVNKVIVSDKSVEITFNEKVVPKLLELIADGEELNIEEKEVAPFIINKKIKLTQPSKSGNILIIKVNDENTPIPNPYLVNVVIKGNYFYKRIQEGATIEKLQTEEGLKDSKYIRNLLNLRFLPPALTEQILNGTQDDNLSLQKLIKMVA